MIEDLERGRRTAIDYRFAVHPDTGIVRLGLILFVKWEVFYLIAFPRSPCAKPRPLRSRSGHRTVLRRCIAGRALTSHHISKKQSLTIAHPYTSYLRDTSVSSFQRYKHISGTPAQPKFGPPTPPRLRRKALRRSLSTTRTAC